MGRNAPLVCQDYGFLMISCENVSDWLLASWDTCFTLHWLAVKNMWWQFEELCFPPCYQTRCFPLRQTFLFYFFLPKLMFLTEFLLVEFPPFRIVQRLGSGVRTCPHLAWGLVIQSTVMEAGNRQGEFLCILEGSVSDVEAHLLLSKLKSMQPHPFVLEL